MICLWAFEVCSEYSLHFRDDRWIYSELLMLELTESLLIPKARCHSTVVREKERWSEFLLKNFWPRTSQQATAAKTISSDLPSLGLGTDSSACSFTDEGMTQSPNFVYVDKDRSGVIALLGCFPTFEDNPGGQSISVILENGFWTLGIQAWVTWLENRTTKSQVCNFSELLYIWKTIISIYDVLQILNC